MPDCNCDYFSGNVGIGTPATTRRLSILGASASPNTIVELIQNGTSDSNYLWFKQSSGTNANPQPVLNAQALGYVAGLGCDAVAPPAAPSYGYGAYLSFNATQNWNSGAHGANIQFSTTPNDTTATATRMTIAPSGEVGIGTESPTANLHVVSGASGATTGRMHHTGGVSSPGTPLVVSNGYAIGDAGGNYEVFGARANNFSTSLLSVRDNGNVGIGTANPGVRLESAGLPPGATTDYIRKSVTSNHQIGFNLRRTGGFDVDAYLYAEPSSTHLRIFHGGTDRLVIAADGNVGIGSSMSPVKGVNRDVWPSSSSLWACVITR